MSRAIGLRGAIVLGVVLPVLVTLAVTAMILLNVVEQRVQDRMQQDVGLIARALRLPLSDALAEGHNHAIVEALRSAFAFNQIYGAYVFDAGGNQIAGIGLGGHAISRRRLAGVAAQGKEKGEYTRPEHRGYYAYFVPLNDPGGRIIGLLQINRRAREVRDYLSAIRGWGIVVLVGLGAWTVLILFLGYRWAVGRPLQRLERAMEQVERGDREHRASVAGPREVRDLARRFNAMLDAIAGKEREVRRRRSEQIQLERRLRRSSKLAAVGALAAGVAHELGTPLSVVDGKAQRALRSPELTGPVRDSLHGMRREAARMERIVTQLLDFARNNPLELREQSLGRIVRSSVARIDDLCRRSGVCVEVNAGRADPVVAVDAGRIEQALVNLLRNAVQAAASRVSVAWEERADGVAVLVDDDGPGVPESLRQTIFDPFFTTKPVGSGTGLGLAIVHSVAEDHSGWIQAGDSPLGGARFELVLRASHAEERHDGN